MEQGEQQERQVRNVHYRLFLDFSLVWLFGWLKRKWTLRFRVMATDPFSRIVLPMRSAYAVVPTSFLP